MRDETGDPHQLLKSQVEQYMIREYPDQYMSQLQLVSFTNKSYQYILQCGKVQKEMLDEVCWGLENISELNKDELERKLKNYQEEIAEFKSQYGLE